MKTLLTGGKIYDGTGNAPFVGDILLEDDRILAVAQRISATDAEKVVDISGLSVAPGFIDAHSHNDWFAIKEDPLPYFEPFIRQGITTFVSGNCGISTVGFDCDTPHARHIGGGLFSFRGTTGIAGDLTEYFDRIDRNAPCNLAVLAGHCSARAGAAGNKSGKLTAQEEQEMLFHLEKALQNGACGISLGLMYEPGLYADTEELKKVAALCEKYDRPLTVHPRANSAVSMSYPELLGRSHLLRAIDELAEIAKGTKLKLHYSHAIFVGRRSFSDVKDMLEIFEKLKQSGVDIGFDIYHEMCGVSVITVILPAWYQTMSMEERKKPLTRLKLAALVQASSLLLGFGFDDIEVAYIGKGYEAYEGKSVAKMRGQSSLQAYLDLCQASNFQGRVNMSPYSTPEIISKLSKHDMCIYMTDAWVEEHGVQNPAIYDCFPKFIRASLLGTGDTMARTIRKMTGQTADRFALQDRGYIRPGCFGDLTVFNEDTMRTAVPDQTKSFGIEKVFINGKLILEDDVLDSAVKTAGRAIRCQ